MKQKSSAAHIASEDPLARIRVILLSVTALIAVVGLADASYLTISHFVGEDVVCGPKWGCSVVLNSSYASIAGIPAAALGALAYFSVFAFATFAAFGYARVRSLLAVLVGAMFIASLWFLYVQAFILHAYCPFCLISAALTFFLAGLQLATPPPR
jgi:uncharacterized membrane protein